MAKNDLKTASVLAFERKLDPSDALLYAGRWEQRDNAASWQPVAVQTKSVRGTISNRLKAKDADPAKLDASIQSPNLQTVDVASLPADCDSLQLRFTLRVLGGAGTPNACNDADYQAALLAYSAVPVRRTPATTPTIRLRYWPPSPSTAASTSWRTATPSIWPTAASCGATAWGPSRWWCASAGCAMVRLHRAGTSMPCRSACVNFRIAPIWMRWLP